MPTMIPETLTGSDAPSSERKLFEILKTLDNNYTVVHSYRFNGNKESECDFIIIHRAYGYITLEVKGGAIEENRQIWYSTDRNGAIHKIKDPYKQASESMHSLNKLFDRKFNSKYTGVFDYAVCFPDINYSHERVMDCTKLSEPQFFFDTLFKNAAAKYFVTPNLDDIKKFTEMVSSEIKTEMALFRIIVEQENELNKINIFQDYLIDLFDDKKRIGFKGAAGSGKTFIAIKKARRLNDAGKSVLFLLFNKHISAFVSEQLHDCQNVNISTFHSFALDIIYNMINAALEDKNISAIFYKEFIPELYADKKDVDNFTITRLTYTIDRYVDSYKEVINRFKPKLGIIGEILDMMLTKNTDELYNINIPLTLQFVFEMNESGIDKYDALIIDEGQDFSKEWCDCLTPVFKSLKSRIVYVFYDDNQNIFRKESSLPVVELISTSEIKDHVFTLKTNLRNTKNIHRYALSITGKENISESLDIDGLEPEEYSFNNGDKAAEQVAIILRELIQKQRLKNEDVVVLSNRSYANSIFSDIEEVAGFKLVKSGEGLRKNSIRFRTIGEYKGLEAKVVILVLQKGKVAITDDLLYVGVTRARHMLFVINVDKC